MDAATERARKRAEYKARTAGTATATALPGALPAGDAAVPAAGAVTAGPVPSVEDVKNAIADVHRMWNEAGHLTTLVDDGVELTASEKDAGVAPGMVQVTDAGFALEAATTEVGRMLSARADARIEEGLAALREEYGLDEDGLRACLISPEAIRIRMGDLDAFARKRDYMVENGEEIDPVMKDGFAQVDADRAMLQSALEAVENANVDEDTMREVRDKVAALRASAYRDVLSEVRRMGAPKGGAMWREAEDSWVPILEMPDEDDYEEEDWDLMMRDDAAYQQTEFILEEHGERALEITPDDAVKLAKDIFPTEWWEASDRSEAPLQVALVAGLGGSCYYPSGPRAGRLVVGVHPDLTPIVGAHETTHRMQHTVHRYVNGMKTHPIAEMEEAFIQRRTGGGPGRTLADRDPVLVMNPIDRFRPDHFSHMYIGKDTRPFTGQAPVTAREVLPVAVESMFGATTGGLMGDSGFRADPDHRAFGFGLMATLPGRFKNKVVQGKK